MYSQSYYDFQKDIVETKPQLYATLNNAKYEINCTIIEILNRDYSIITNDEFLFIINPITKENYPIEQKLNISKSMVLIFKKREMSIDIYLNKLSKGYVYNSEKIMHLYKFHLSVIHTNNEDLSDSDIDINQNNIFKYKSLEFDSENQINKDDINTTTIKYNETKDPKDPQTILKQDIYYTPQRTSSLLMQIPIIRNEKLIAELNEKIKDLKND